MSERIWDGLRKNALYKSTYTYTLLIFYRDKTNDSIRFPNFYPKTSPKWASIGILILKLAYYWNYCTDFNQILHNDRGHQIIFVGGPDRRITNPRWRTAASLVTVKSLYLSNGSTCRSEIWCDDTWWLYSSYRPLKFEYWEIQDGGQPLIQKFENLVNRQVHIWNYVLVIKQQI